MGEESSFTMLTLPQVRLARVLTNMWKLNIFSMLSFRMLVDTHAGIDYVHSGVALESASFDTVQLHKAF